MLMHKNVESRKLLLAARARQSDLILPSESVLRLIVSSTSF